MDDFYRYAPNLRDTACLQQRLNAFSRERLKPAFPRDDWREAQAQHNDLALEEGEFLEGQRAQVVDRASQAPQDAESFVRWFEDLKSTGPGQHDPLFPWLAEEANMEQMKWFLAQEVAGEAGFEDITALAQLRLDIQPKLEMARNYWDEMGRGNAKGMHGPLLSALTEALDLRSDSPVSESLALANTMAGLALNRRYAYHAIGALGVIELTAPDRAAHVNAGLARLGVSARTRHYFALHAVLDVRHSEAWNAEVLRPLAEADGRVTRFLAEGALMRLECGAACFRRYRAELWG